MFTLQTNKPKLSYIHCTVSKANQTKPRLSKVDQTKNAHFERGGRFAFRQIGLNWNIVLQGFIPIL